MKLTEILDEFGMKWHITSKVGGDYADGEEIYNATRKDKDFVYCAKVYFWVGDLINIQDITSTPINNALKTFYEQQYGDR